MSNPWITTYTGQAFYPFNPNPDSVCIEDIAHALSNICRFNGHTKRHYSVAEHSIRVACLLKPRSPEEQLWGLLHDAAEAYLGDIVSPLKPKLSVYFPSHHPYGDEWVQLDKIEDKILKVIITKFPLVWPMPDSVEHADLVMLATEGRDLLADGQAAWLKELPKPHPGLIHDYRDAGGCNYPEFWEQEFLRMFNELSMDVSG